MSVTFLRVRKQQGCRHLVLLAPSCSWSNPTMLLSWCPLRKQETSWWVFDLMDLNIRSSPNIHSILLSTQPISRRPRRARRRRSCWSPALLQRRRRGGFAASSRSSPVLTAPKAWWAGRTGPDQGNSPRLLVLDQNTQLIRWASLGVSDLFISGLCSKKKKGLISRSPLLEC